MRTGADISGHSKHVTSDTTTKVCATVEINACKFYESISACEECHIGFEKAVDGATCDCASPKVAAVDSNGLPICVNSSIDNCTSYVSVSACHTCATGYDKASSGASCTKQTPPPPAPVPSSGYVLGFEFLAVLLFALLI